MEFLEVVSYVRINHSRSFKKPKFVMFLYCLCWIIFLPFAINPSKLFSTRFWTCAVTKTFRFALSGLIATVA